LSSAGFAAVLLLSELWHEAEYRSTLDDTTLAGVDLRAQYSSTVYRVFSNIEMACGKIF
jgi:hypothetical protein